MDDICINKEFLQKDNLPFGDILNQVQFKKIVEEATVHWQEKVYPPLVTLEAFIKQTLNADHSCKKAVADIMQKESQMVKNRQLLIQVLTAKHAKGSLKT